MHAYFGQWKARCACFVHKNNLGTGESLLICVNKKKNVHRGTPLWPASGNSVFGNSVFSNSVFTIEG